MNKERKKWLKKGFKIFSRKNKTDYLAKKIDQIKEINSHAENGKILIVVGGCDCDGVEYYGRCYVMASNYITVNHFKNQQCDWSDGSIYFDYAKPSTISDYNFKSRDLTLEAFENGHSHIIHR